MIIIVIIKGWGSSLQRSGEAAHLLSMIRSYLLNCYLSICTYIYIYIYIYTYICIYVYVCVCIYIYIYIYLIERDMYLFISLYICKHTHNIIYDMHSMIRSREYWLKLCSPVYLCIHVCINVCVYTCV